jgi:DNA mismatch endonuclease (patch repair protein)
MHPWRFARAAVGEKLGIPQRASVRDKIRKFDIRLRAMRQGATRAHGNYVGWVMQIRPPSYWPNCSASQRLLSLSCKIPVLESLIKVMSRSAKKNGQRPRTKAQISFNMSQIRSTGSKIEKVLEAAFTKANLSPEKHPPVLGRPDFAFVSKRVAIFCDSHFWHGYEWKKRSRELKRNRQFWIDKIESNRRRDRFVNRGLRTSGWQVLRFWEHQILHSSDRCVSKVMDVLQSRVGEN